MPLFAMMKWTTVFRLIVMRTQKKGFTLIELLMVIAIIGILASIVLASLSGAREKGRDGKRLAEVRQMQVAIELYHDDNGEYPPETSSGMPGTHARLPDELVTQGYIAKLPTDPVTGIPYRYDRGDNFLGDNPGTVSCPGGARQCYALQVDLEQGDGGTTCVVTDGTYDDADQVVYYDATLDEPPLCAGI